MYLTSRSGRRTMSVAMATRDRVIAYICDTPGKAVKEYSHDLLVAESTVNLIIELFLMDAVAAGHIAVSDRGRRPDWYYQTPDQDVVPVKRISKRRSRVNLSMITDKELRHDYSALALRYDDALTAHLSPRRRDMLRREFFERVIHVGGSHQDTINQASEESSRLATEVRAMKEAIQVLANAVTRRIAA